MSVRRRGARSSAFITALMVVFALVIPFAGTALAQDVTALTLTPETDTARAGTCNAFTITVTGPQGTGDNNPGVAGETIDVRVTDADADDNGGTTTGGGNTTGGANESDITFCDPPEFDPNVEESGPNSQLAQTGAVAGPNSAGTTGFTQNNTDDNTTNQIQGEVGTTNESGQITFGILSSEEGTFSVLAFADENDDERVSAGEATDNATKTFTPGFQTGGEAVEELDCEPEEERNAEGDTFEFVCTATDENGNPVSGATVSFDVTDGPNEEEVEIRQCNAQTAGEGGSGQVGSQNRLEFGQARCQFTDEDEEDDNPEQGSTTSSEPGTDTIVAFVSQAAPSGQTGTAGPDAFEPQDTIQKTFVGDANNIECTPDEGTANSGDIVEVTCTVTSEEGEGIPGIEVDFTETGAGAFRTGDDDECTTDEDGQCTIELITNQTEEGTITVTGTIQGAANNSEFESNCIGGVAETGSGADCSDTATVTVTQEPEPDPETDCNDGVDNDGDGRIDFGDDPGCTSSQDPSEVGGGGGGDGEPTRVATNLTIRYDRNDNAFKGSVGSSRKACQTGRTVLLKKVTPGPNRTVGRDTSNRNGNWRINKARARGRFYAIVLRQDAAGRTGRQFNCLRDRSVTIKVGRRR